MGIKEEFKTNFYVPIRKVKGTIWNSHILTDMFALVEIKSQNSHLHFSFLFLQVIIWPDFALLRICRY